MAKFRTEYRKGPLMRMSYAFNLQAGREQKKDDGTTKMEYGCSLILPTSDAAGLAWLRAQVAECVMGEWGEKGVEKFKIGLIKNPILLGDGKEARNKQTGEISPGLGPDVVFIRVKSNDPVKVFNKAVLPASKEEIISGWWGYPVLNAFAWSNPKNGDGVTFGISMIQVFKEDAVLGGDGAPNPDKFFEKVETAGGGALTGGAADMFAD